MNADTFHRVKHRIILYLYDMASSRQDMAELSYKTHEELDRIAINAVKSAYCDGVSNRKWADLAKDVIKKERDKHGFR
jgi:hypothetical protein